MNLVEAGRLLAKVSGNDGREVGEVTVMAWQETLADVAYPDAMAAVTIHYRESTEFLMPAHLVKLVGRVRAERRQADLDRRHADKIAAFDEATLPATTRRAIEQATGARRQHNVTVRRRDDAGTRWAFSCTCGVNPPDQEWPSKAVARAKAREHMPTPVARGAQ
jgi:hypothetical protein